MTEKEYCENIVHNMEHAVERKSKQEQTDEDGYKELFTILSRSDLHKALKQSKDLEKTLTAINLECERHTEEVQNELTEHLIVIKGILGELTDETV